MKPTTIIFVVGRIGSGKTTISIMLDALGYTRISAGTCLASVYAMEKDRQPTRIELANFGQALRRHNRLNEFHLELRTRVDQTKSCCIDGLRFAESVREFSNYSKKSFLIFLSCPDDVRRARLSSRRDKLDFDALAVHETEISVEEMRKKADVTVDTSSDVATAFDLILQAMNRSAIKVG